MAEENVRLSSEGSIAHITLNRPDVLNSLNESTTKQLLAALETAGADESVRAIVLSGSGNAFCAGQDIREILPGGPLRKDTDATELILKLVEERCNAMVRAIRHNPKPIICAVQGAAVGAGANLALCCDIVIAAKDSYFSQGFIKIGLVPDTGGTYYLPRLVGLPRATALMMTGEKVSAAEAEAMGMIYKAVPSSSLKQVVSETANRIANLPTKTIALIKEALNSTFENTLEKQLDTEAKLQVTAANTEDHKEGLFAFVEKRNAEFKGK